MEKSPEFIPDKFEIERKFALEITPENSPLIEQALKNATSTKDILQIYLSAENAEAVRRIRAITENGEQKFYFTEKDRDTGISRREREREISKAEFDQLYSQNEEKFEGIINKTRYEIPADPTNPTTSPTVELDVYRGNLAGLITAEIEFPSQEKVTQFEVPAWLTRLGSFEVTGDKKYRNDYLAKEGKPK